MNFSAEVFIRDNTVISTTALVPEIKLYSAPLNSPLFSLTVQRLDQGGEPPPYWALAWPGGQGMARFILDHPTLFHDKNVLDFAAGSGIAALAAKKVGAHHVLACEIDPLANVALVMNARLNGLSLDVIREIPMDRPSHKFDIIVAGDVCYQPAMSARLTRWLRLCRSEGVQIFLADPGRAYVPEAGLLERALYEIETPYSLEHEETRQVQVWEMIRGDIA